MKVSIAEAGQLTPEQIRSWRECQQALPLLQNPFLSPEFTQVVASVRDDVRIAIARDGHGAEAYFPFQRTGGRALPVGVGLNEWQAVVAPPNFAWSTDDFLRAAGVRSWSFDHLVQDQPLQNWAIEEVTPDEVYDSPFLDLSRGYQAFVMNWHQANSQFWKQMQRKRRKLEREVGPLRFELHAAPCFERLVEWKRKQHLRTGVLDIFRFPWVTEVLAAVSARQEESFQGTMSGLWAGEHLLAVHLGMIHGGVAHVWYPAYDIDYGKYSPGILLFFELIRELCGLKVQRLDFGPGPQQYKQKFRTGETRLALGTMDRSLVVRALRSHWRSTKAWLRSSPLHGPVRLPATLLFRLRQWWSFRSA